MTTLSDLIDETFSILLSTHADPLNKLNGAINSSVTSLTTTYDLKAIAPSTYLSIDLEDFYVWDAPAAKTATVQRGVRGSTAASHVDGSLITVNPKFSKFQVLKEINAELDSLSTNAIFRVGVVEATYKPSQQTYEIPGETDVDRVLNVSYNEPGSHRAWPQIKSFRLRRNAETDDFPSGFAVTIYEGASPGRELRITYAAPLAHLAALTDDVAAVSGLVASAHDILPLGAAVRLSGYRELARSLFEGYADSRRAGEVPPGSQIRASQPYLQQYLKRVREEAGNFASDYPFTRRVPA